MTDAAPARPNMALNILAFLAVIGAIVLGRSFLMPVVLGFLLSLTFSPVRRVLQRRGVPPWATATLVVVGLLIGSAGLIMALSSPAQEYVEDRETIASDVERKLRGISEAIEKVSDASEQVEKMASGEGGGDTASTATEAVTQSEDASEEEEEPQKVVVEGPSLVSRMAWGAPAVVAQVVFTLVLLFFLTASGDMFYEKIVQAAPTFRDKKRALGIAYDIERKLSRYFLTITIINAGLGIAVGTALWWLGMPNALLFGVMAFALNFIPFLGAIFGVVVTFAIGIVSFDTVGHAAVAAGAYLALTTLEGNFITPYAVGRSLKLNPVLVFLAVAFWGWAWSVIGMFVAVPALIALRVFAEKVPNLNWLAIFLSGQETPEEQAESKKDREEDSKEKAAKAA